jgi:hypothetical protein
MPILGQFSNHNQSPRASGGTTSTITGYIVHTFNESSNFIFSKGIGNLEYLVIAGGGGGGQGRGGGGGAGGYLTNTLSATIGTNYTVTVGAGGNPSAQGTNSVFSSATAIGGGRGGTHLSNDNGGSGGSGGGAAMNYTTNIWSGGSPTAGQGNAGAGSGNQGNDDPRNTGGGGGAGAAGTRGAGTGTPPAGGVGLQFSITGVSTYYAGGGGGARGGTDRSNAGAGVGGLGGGGTGEGNLTGTNGAANTGGGGGGAEGGGFNGGSGVVIIAYPNNFANITTIPGTLTYTLDTTTRAGYKVYNFTAGTGTITI